MLPTSRISIPLKTISSGKITASEPFRLAVYAHLVKTKNQVPRVQPSSGFFARYGFRPGDLPMFSLRVKLLSFSLPLVLMAGSRPVMAQATNFGTVAIGQTGIAQSVTLTFTSAGYAATQLALTAGAKQQDFAATPGGTCNIGQTYTAGATCTVAATFAPLYAGLRSGAIVLQDISGNTLASAYVYGVGSGPQAGFHPTAASTSFPYLGVTADKGVAVDGAGDVFLSSHNSTTASDSVVEIPAGCSAASCLKQLPGTFYGIWGLAVDGAGNVWVGDVGANGTVTEILASGGYAATKKISGNFGNQIGIAVDVSRQRLLHRRQHKQSLRRN